MHGTAPTSVAPAAPATPAPAAPAAPAPVSTEATPETGTAPVEPASPATTEVVSPPAPTSDGAVASPEFDWTAWDGKLEAIPEQWREVGQNISGYYTKQLEKYKDFDKISAEKERLQKLYDTAIENLGDDPRVAELETERSQVLQQLEEQKTAYSTLESQFNAYREQEARAYADNLARTYPKYFTDAAEKAKLSAMLEEGWDPEVAIKVLELGGSALDVAREAKAKGAPDLIAYEFAELRGKSSGQKPQPREAAKVMAGAEPASQPAKAQRTLADAKTHQERVKIAAARALKLHSAGGK